jgi:Zn-dependent peptidase ImmA (M78 family)/DNA-binding XRE family transcriptional regulator
MRTNQTFNGDRLKKALTYHGMSVGELADRVGCQRQTISMYVNGKSKPMDEDVVHRLSEALHFPVKYFYDKNSAIKVGATYFRALLTTNQKYRSEQVQKMEFVAQIYEFLQEYISFHPLNMPHFASNATPEEAATLLREAWGLGNRPIENIIHEVEQHGILVTSFSTSTDDVDAFSQRIDINGSSYYLIGYSNNKTSAARIHFDIAHELGHICLHDWSDDVEKLDKEDFKTRENEAHRFAAAFLLPEETYYRDAIRMQASVPQYTQLKRKWKVSIAAMLRRSHNLGIISMDDYQMMMRILQRRGLRKEEPLDDVLLTAEPSLLKTAVVMLLNEKVFTAKQFMDELSFAYDLSLNPSMVEYLLDLPKGLLSPSEIIPFHGLRLVK